MDYELPDGSKVKLMGNSSLSYNRVTWFWERKLQLLGKALFKVTPERLLRFRPKPETFQCSEPNSWWYNKGRKCL